MNNAGEYGGRVLRGFKGDGIGFIAGAIITPEIAVKFPLANRMALHTQGFVEWFAKPDAEEQEARKEGKPAPARGKVAAEAKPKPQASTGPSSGTTHSRPNRQRK